MYVSRPTDLGSLLRDRRVAKGLSQATLAKQLGVRQAWVSDLENGKFSSRIDLVLAALKAVGVRLWADIGDDAPVPGAGKKPDIDINALVDDMLKEL